MADYADNKKHTLSLDDRSDLFLTGVLDVDNYDEHTVTVRTSRGILSIEGDGLHVKHLTLETGELSLCGTVSALWYTEDTKAGSGNGGFFARLFR